MRMGWNGCMWSHIGAPVIKPERRCREPPGSSGEAPELLTMDPGVKLSRD